MKIKGISKGKDFQLFQLFQLSFQVVSGIDLNAIFVV